MGSSQPHDGNRPFGYTFAPDDNLFLNPPEPAPGQPILTQEEDQALNNFFNQITANQYSVMSFGEGLNFSEAWHELPPQFMGTATSYGHQPAHSMGSSFLDYPEPNFDNAFQFAPNTMAPPPQPAPLPLPLPPQRQPPPPPLQHPPTEQSTPAEAAAVLTSLHHGIPRQTPNANPAPILAPQPVGPPLPNHSVNQNRNHFKTEHISPVRATPATIGPALSNLPEQRNEHLFTEMAFGNPFAPAAYRAAQLPNALQWGSDTSFGRGRSFMPSSERETAPALESQRTKYIEECLTLSNSVNNTRPPSPVANGDSDKDQLNSHGQKEPEMPARKRTQSQAAEGADDEEEDSLTTPAKPTTAKKRKSKVDLGKSEDVTAVNDTPGKRRKSNATGARPPRENLSEEQKRSNHIKSEQKRRTLIKGGFDDLQVMVPSLKNGGHSKSAMLSIAGEWLAELLKDNEMLSS